MGNVGPTRSHTAWRPLRAGTSQRNAKAVARRAGSLTGMFESTRLNRIYGITLGYPCSIGACPSVPRIGASLSVTGSSERESGSLGVIILGEQVGEYGRVFQGRKHGFDHRCEICKILSECVCITFTGENAFD